MEADTVVARASALMAGHAFALVRLQEIWWAHLDKDFTLALGAFAALTGLVMAYGMLLAHKKHERVRTTLEISSGALFIGRVGAFVSQNLGL